MSTLAVVAVLLAIPLGFWFGVHIGRSWGSLPSLAPHSIVSFRGPDIGTELRMYVEVITRDGDGTTVALTSRGSR